MSITPLDPAAPDDIPERLRELPQIEECHSVAGDENYILKVRVDTPAELEELIASVRGVAERLDAHDRRPLHALGVAGAGRVGSDPAERTARASFFWPVQRRSGGGWDLG
jgi:DNA-binding Lrp family transcriptional regulator